MRNNHRGTEQVGTQRFGEEDRAQERDAKEMIEPRRYKVVRAECPLCGKVLESLSEKHWIFNFKMHLRLAQTHMLSWEEIDRIVETIKPSFRTIIKTRYRIKKKRVEEVL